MQRETLARSITACKIRRCGRSVGQTLAGEPAPGGVSQCERQAEHRRESLNASPKLLTRLLLDR